ncbi:AMP-binding protein [Streptomyces tendae]
MGHGITPAEPSGSELVHSLLDEAAAEAPSACAVRDDSGAWSYRQLVEISHGFARRLRALGVRPGDRIVVQAETTRELVAMFFGTSRSGAVFVPLNPAMKQFHLRSVIANAEPRLIVADTAAAERLRETTAVPVHTVDSLWPDAARSAGPPAAGEHAEVASDAIAALIYTSGSTASPKAVISPHAQVTFASRAIQAELAYRPDDVVFCRFPMSWDYGLYKVLLSCLGRSELVLAGQESDLSLIRRMRETGTTIVPVVPSLATMIATLVGRDRGALPPVRLFTNTGAALPRSTIDALREAFPGARVVRQFGQTECKRIAIMPPELEHERPDSVGRPLPGTEVRILDEDGRPVPTGRSGEIVVLGPHVMPGYWRSPELTAATFRTDEATGGLRLHTGDYGRLDEDGYLYFDGRRDDMFKRKGLRMSVLEIEAAAMDIPGIRAATAVPPGREHDLTLFVETDLAPQAVLRELARRLEPAKVPAECRALAELPLTQHGKNERRQLAAMLEGSHR